MLGQSSCGRRVFGPKCATAGQCASRGATITEIVIAATLLSFVVLGSLAAISSALQYSNHARMVTLASQVIQSAMEGLRLKNYADLKTLAAQTQPVAITSTVGSELTSSTFTQTMTVNANFTTLVASSPSQLGLIGVEVTVSWTEGTVPFTRSTRTYFAEKGLSDYIYVGF
jgi:Tfp pilus assembly protein PilV